MTKMADSVRWGFIVALAAAFVAGCETTSLENEGQVTLNELQGIAAAPAEEEGGGSTSDDTTTTTTTGDGGWPTEITGSIRWLHTDVSGWAVTARLSGAGVKGGHIHFPYDKARVWPGRTDAGTVVNANPWVIVNINGQWYAGTFEWLRPGQTSKPTSVLTGRDHIKVSPLSGWKPRSGERIGIMVSGLARGNSRNVRERSNVQMITWP